jgi:hypothetical protein
MDFEKRLQNAIQRGQKRCHSRRDEALAKVITEEELKQLHGQYRLQLSEHIEHCVQRLPHYFPGFQYETIFGERGWGAACSRDDIRVLPGGKRTNLYSRFELAVRPFSRLHVLEMSGKGAIRNKEVFHRTHFEKIEDSDPDKFLELVDLWVLEYAELYAAEH